MGIAEKLVKNYKAGLAVSFTVLFVSIGIISFNLATTGKAVSMGIDFTGGAQATVEIERGQAINIASIESAVASAIGGEARVRAAETQLFIESSQQLEKEKVSEALRYVGIRFSNIDLYTVGPALGAAFFVQATQAIAAALAVMAIVAFAAFRNLAASIAITLAGGSNLIFALAGMSVLGLPLNLATFAGLLMVIGYSIDTNILLTTRVIKRKAEPLTERMASSLNTGLTMTGTSIASVLVLYVIASAAPFLQQIAGVILLGLIADLTFTWLQNAGLLRIYSERKERKAKGEVG